MTHEQYIEFETAKLAKLAGFDWECSTFYAETFDYTNQDGTGKFEFRRNDNLRYRNPNDDHNSWVNHGGTLLEYKFEMFSAPTQSVLQRWLREEKDMLILIDFEKGEQHFQYLITSYSHPDSDTAKVGGWYNSLETALEAGLKKCLTLIIEEKQ